MSGAGYRAAVGDWKIPEPRAIAEVRLADGTVTILRRHGNPSGPRLVLSHGCGLAADLYYPYWSLLADRLDVFVFDLRSHGWNAVSPLRTHNMPTLVDDSRCVLDAIDSSFGPKPSVGVFHSISTIVALVHQQQAPAFAGLVLFDPPINSPGAGLNDMELAGERLARRARRRQRHFDSREDLAEILGQAPAYSLVPPETLSLLAETTLRPAAGGGYELRCPPRHEAQLFEWYFGFSMQTPEIIECLDIPVKAIGADPTVRFSFLPSMDLSTLAVLDYDFIPHMTHFLQLEAPEECAALTVDFMETQRLL